MNNFSTKVRISVPSDKKKDSVEIPQGYTQENWAAKIIEENVVDIEPVLEDDGKPKNGSKGKLNWSF